MITRQMSVRGYSCALGAGMYSVEYVERGDARVRERGRERAVGFELKRQKHARGLDVGTRRAPEQPCGSLVFLISELLLSSGLFRNGLKAASVLRLGARGATHCSTFTQVAGECNIVDLLEVLLDFASGMFQ